MGFFDEILPNLPSYQENIPSPSNLRYRNSMVPDSPDLSTPALNQFRSYLSSIPSEANYRPSGLRRVGAAIAGFGSGMTGGADRGFQTAENITRAPYQNALTDWSIRGKGLQDAATLENKNQGVENSAWRNYATALNAQGKLAQGDERVRQGDERIGNVTEANRIKKQQADTNKQFVEAKISEMGQGNWKVVYDKKGTPDHVVNSKTGTAKALVDDKGNPLDVSGPPEQFAAALDRALKVANIQAETSRANNKDTIAGANERNDATIKGANERAVLPKTDTSTVTKEKQKESNVLRDLATENPAWQKFIGQNKSTGAFHVIPAGEGNWLGSDQTEYQKFYKEFMNRKGSSVTPKVTSPTVKTAGPKSDETRVVNGKTYKWDGKGWLEQ